LAFRAEIEYNGRVDPAAKDETSKNRRRRRGSASNVRYFNASGAENQSSGAIFAEILPFY
jgi:hypothetical protein